LEAYESIGREVLSNTLVKFLIPMKLARLIKMYLNEKTGKVRIGKYLFENFPL
jgi:hypothetical protein